MAEEWGPWIEHDGRGCPCVGQYVQVEFHEGTVMEGIAGHNAAQAIADGFDPYVAWKWALVSTTGLFFNSARIIRYRIRKPRALTDLKRLLADLPADLPETVDA